MLIKIKGLYSLFFSYLPQLYKVEHTFVTLKIYIYCHYPNTKESKHIIIEENKNKQRIILKLCINN